MRYEKLIANLNHTVRTMKAQTGKEPGGPTGMCFPIVLGALTGKNVLFESLPEDSQALMERRLGIVKYPIYPLRNQPIIETMPAVLSQREISMDAVLVRGTVEGEKHRVAVVPDEGAAPYHVVDSLLPGATTTLNTIQDVTDFLHERFDAKTMRGFVIPNEREIERRRTVRGITELVRIDDEVSIQIIPSHY